MNNEKILIFDIETQTLAGKPDPKTDIFKFFGCYSYITERYYFLTDLDKVRDIIKKHDIIIGFNSGGYDNQVLYNNGLRNIMYKREGYDDFGFNYKTNIDLFTVFKKRAGAMKIKKGMLGNLLMRYSLDYISKTIGIVDDDTGKIKDFDYSIFKKSHWTKQELDLIVTYLKRDVEVTKKMYDWLEDYFSGFREFVSQEDIDKKKYLTTSTAVFAYKAICKKLKLKEEYNHDMTGEKYGGGYVSYPAGEEFHGNIYCLDYNSLYPSIFHQCNLYSPTIEPEHWNGNGVFNVKGKYNNKEQGKIEKLLKELYEQRLELKKVKDPREYSIKIIINTMYGLSGNPSFKHLYSRTTASDCTLLARQWVKLARNIFRDAGYKIIYTDTDSWYFVDTYNDEPKVLETKDILIKKIKDNVPFPYTKFDAGVDYKITDMWFFKGKTITSKESDSEMDEDDFLNKPKNLMKKNYIFLTTDGKIVVKNLGVMKKSTSLLTRKIFWDYLVPMIKAQKKVKFPKKWFEDKIAELLGNDLELATKRYMVGNASSYKNASQLQSQISKRYGSGIHFLIPNYRLGVGKGKKYCTLAEFKEKKLNMQDLDLKSVWNELGYFIDIPKPKSVFEF